MQAENKSLFVKDPEEKKISVSRKFEATPEQVWQAWTDSKMLDQWWGPKPWKANTKEMDFKEGGYWLYSMDGPSGEQHWSRADFETIDAGKQFTYSSAFCDEAGNITSEFPPSRWTCTFSEEEEATLVEVSIEFEKEGHYQQLIDMGFEEGFTAGHRNLDELLATGRVA